jgi:hypothetical protein
MCSTTPRLARVVSTLRPTTRVPQHIAGLNTLKNIRVRTFSTSHLSLSNMEPVFSPKAVARMHITPTQRQVD